MKKLLFLGYKDSRLIPFLKSELDVTQTEEKLNLEEILKLNPDKIISYGYRHIIKEDILDKYKIINLHIAYLPYNQGVSPNFFSFLENTPKGVTIHYMDKGIDTGDILLNKKIDFKNGTLNSTYWDLRAEIEGLFIKNWNDLRDEKINPTKQESGTYHDREAEKLMKFLMEKNNWDYSTQVNKIKDYGLKHGFWKYAEKEDLEGLEKEMAWLKLDVDVGNSPISYRTLEKYKLLMEKMK